jgi:uncharacterized protein (DUF1697 family)
MQCFVVLLRAVNVGGTGKLPMSDLKLMCEQLGFQNVRTYISSGNVVLNSQWDEQITQHKLEVQLNTYARKKVGIYLRTPQEMAAILSENPFADAPGNRNVVIFLQHPPPANTIEQLSGQVDEKLILGKREIYVNYGQGMSTSKLKIPAAKLGTARNMNTVAKLVEMTSPLRISKPQG